MNFVYAKATQQVVTEDGGRYTVYRNDIRHPDDPVVKAAPHLFTADPSELMLVTPGFAPQDDDVVEQATAAPGEKRSRVHRG